VSLITSGKLLPGPLVERLVTIDQRKLTERAFGPLLLLVAAPLEDSGAFVRDLVSAVERVHEAPPSAGSVLSTAEFPTLGFEPGEPSEADQVELIAELGADTHVVVPLVPREGQQGLLLGRAASATVVLADPSVSGRHARIEVEDGGARLTDLESKNGTLLNGERLEAGQARWLQPMDRLMLGRIQAFACDPRALRAVLRSDLKSLF
jgi:hypothetical protein